MPPPRDPALPKVESASQEGHTQPHDICGHTSLSSQPTGQRHRVSYLWLYMDPVVSGCTCACTHP